MGLRRGVTVSQESSLKHLVASFFDLISAIGCQRVIMDVVGHILCCYHTYNISFVFILKITPLYVACTKNLHIKITKSGGLDPFFHMRLPMMGERFSIVAEHFFSTPL